ncbi:hypothetical protein D3C84_795340 [compost metagenome]
MRQRPAQHPIIVEAVQCLIRPCANDQSLPPVFDQCGQIALLQAGEPAPVSLRMFEQLVDAAVVDLIEGEDKRPGVRQVSHLGFAVQARILVVPANLQQRLARVALVLRVQNEAQDMAKTLLLEHPLAG